MWLPVVSWHGPPRRASTPARAVNRGIAASLTLNGASHRLDNRVIDTLPSIRAGIDRPATTAEFSTDIDTYVFSGRSVQRCEKGNGILVTVAASLLSR